MTPISNNFWLLFLIQFENVIAKIFTTVDATKWNRSRNVSGAIPSIKNKVYLEVDFSVNNQKGDAINILCKY